MVGRSKSGWDATGGAYSATTPEDGGVTVLSKWPIIRKEQFIYKGRLRQRLVVQQGLRLCRTEPQRHDGACGGNPCAVDRLRMRDG